LPWDTWRTWVRADSKSDITGRLNELNLVMESLGRPFGHRLFRAIHAYLANHPNGEDSQDAWSDQVAMKVIPRLRGLECDDPRVRAGLQRLAGQIPEDLQEAFDRARAGDFFAWQGAPELYRVDG